MAQDITEQADQEAIADSLISEPEAPPQEQTETEEAQPEEPIEQEAAEQTEETADDWLPTEQEKVFPDEVLARYAQRYNIDLAKADPQTRQLVIDKINSDIYLNSLKTREQEEPEKEEFEEGTEQQPEPTQPQPQISFDQHIKNFQTVVQQRTSPEMAQWMYRGFMKAFGVPEAEVNALAPAQAQAFTEVLSVGALNLIQTFAPELFSTFVPQVMEQQFPEFSGMYQRSATASSWDSIRNSNQDAELPAYGTREYSTAARKIGAEIAGTAERFEAMTFKDSRTGRQFSDAENRAEKLRMIAERMIQGSQEAPVTPAIVAQAVQTGQKIAQRAAAQRSAGNLGAGKSRAQIAATGNDDIFAEGMEIYQREHGSL